MGPRAGLNSNDRRQIDAPARNEPRFPDRSLVTTITNTNLNSKIF
jgi:hypothetical protein